MYLISIAFKQPFIYAMHNCYPSFIFETCNAIFWNSSNYSSITQFLNGPKYSSSVYYSASHPKTLMRYESVESWLEPITSVLWMEANVEKPGVTRKPLSTTSGSSPWSWIITWTKLAIKPLINQPPCQYVLWLICLFINISIHTSIELSIITYPLSHIQCLTNSLSLSLSLIHEDFLK